jgi:hypothetical protein
MNARSMLLGALIILAPASAIAQSNERFNIVGVVDKIDATSISLKNDADGRWKPSNSHRISLLSEQAGDSRISDQRFCRLGGHSWC